MYGWYAWAWWDSGSMARYARAWWDSGSMAGMLGLGGILGLWLVC